MVMGTGEIANTIELNIAELIENVREIRRAERGLGQALRVKPEPSGLTIGNA